MLHTKSFNYQVFTHDNELNHQDLELLNNARQMTKHSYAAYSKFHVGACAMLDNGKIITGCNYENASFGATICAERVLLGSLQASEYRNNIIKTLAISYCTNGLSNSPVTPCGICRQSLLEYEINNGCSIKLIMAGMSGEIWIIEGVHNIIPLGYTKTDLTK